MPKPSFIKTPTSNAKEFHPSYGEVFGDPEYLRKLTQQAPSLSEKEFLSRIMEAIYFFRLPLVAFKGLMEILASEKDQEKLIKDYEGISEECNRLLHHLEDLMKFIKAFEHHNASVTITASPGEKPNEHQNANVAR